MKTMSHKEEYDLFLLIQIASSIQVSQNLFNFVHYDLTTWNILLQKQDKDLEIDYVINEKTCITIKKDDILFESTPVLELTNQYNDMFGSGIQIATSIPKL